MGVLEGFQDREVEAAMASEYLLPLKLCGVDINQLWFGSKTMHMYGIANVIYLLYTNAL